MFRSGSDGQIKTVIFSLVPLISLLPAYISFFNKNHYLFPTFFAN